MVQQALSRGRPAICIDMYKGVSHYQGLPNDRYNVVTPPAGAFDAMKEALNGRHPQGIIVLDGLERIEFPFARNSGPAWKAKMMTVWLPILFELLGNVDSHVVFITRTDKDCEYPKDLGIALGFYTSLQLNMTPVGGFINASETQITVKKASGALRDRSVTWIPQLPPWSGTSQRGPSCPCP
jgi:hypothetical protein